MKKNKDKKNSFKKCILPLAMSGIMLAGCSTTTETGAVWYRGTENIETIDYGKTGDFYWDTDDYIVYEKQSDGSWVVAMNNFGKPGANNTSAAKEIELNKSATHIQWRHEGDSEWTNLIALDLLKGSAGSEGATPHIDPDTKHWMIGSTDTGIVAEATNGNDGKTVEVANNSGVLQWRYTTGTDTVWNDLVTLSTLEGADGTNGKEVEIKINGEEGSEKIQWRYTTGTDTNWKDLIAVADLKGTNGVTPRIGDDGYWYIGDEKQNTLALAQEIELQKSATAIQWKYKNETVWKDLVTLESLKGADGATWHNGTDVSAENLTSSVGKIGDFYLNISTYDIFKKGEESWLKIGNIKGKDYEDIREYFTNIFDKTSDENQQGGIMSTIGVFTPIDASYFTTHLIPVEYNKSYIWNTYYGSLYGKSEYNRVFLYDENGEFLRASKATINENGTIYTNNNSLNDDLAFITITDQDVKYIRLNAANLNTCQLMIVPETESGLEYPTTFIEFGKKLYKDKDVALTESEYEMLIKQNPLYNKSIAFEGDSICRGGSVPGSYARFIGENNNMTMVNNSVSGGTITSGVYDANENARHSIVDGVEALIAQKDNYDYIIFEGGVNDKSLDSTNKPSENPKADNYYVNFGAISSGYNAELDKTTFCGAFEYTCKLLANSGKKVGYIFVHKIHNDDLWNETYRPAMIEMLNKWGIPYLDLETLVPPLNMTDELRNTYTIPAASDPSRGDGWHPNELGYKTFYVDKITAWLKTL